MYSLHGFLFKIFPCAARDYTGAARNCPDTPFSPRTGPPPALFPRSATDSHHRAPETQKGGRISPAANTAGDGKPHTAGESISGGECFVFFRHNVLRNYFRTSLSFESNSFRRCNRNVLNSERSRDTFVGI